MYQDKITLKTEEEVKKMMYAGNIVAICHRELKKYLKEGLSLIEVDNFVNDIILQNDAKSIIKGYDGFDGYNCISVNDCVVHGIPNKRILKDGDIVGIDISVIKDGYIADSCWSYAIGTISEENKNLLTHTEKALFKGLSQVKDGVHLGNVSFAIEKYSRRANLGIVKELAGHGVGTELHEEPLIPNYGKKNRGIIMRQGMTLAIEPMLNLGSEEIYMDEDSWSVKTMDGSNSAHFEHTIVVTNYGHEIITIERTKEEIESFTYNR